MTESHISPIWQAAANNVISGLLGIPELFDHAAKAGITPQHFPPGNWRLVYPAIMQMRRDGQECVGATVAAAASTKDHQVDPSWVDVQMTRCDFLIANSFDDNLKVLESQSMANHDGHIYLDAYNRIQSGDPRHEVAASVISQVGRDAWVGVQDADATSIATRIGDLLAAEPVMALDTGIPFVNKRTFGFQKDQIWFIVAHYKGWKSRLLRNMALAASRAGGSVTLAIFEGAQLTVSLQIISMLAAEWLYQQDKFDDTLPDGSLVREINVLETLTLRKTIRETWPALRLKALDAGIAEFSKIGNRLRIYDKSQHNGRLTNFDSIMAMFLRDKTLYGGVDLLGLDYLQNVGDASRIFEQVTSLTQALQDLAMFEHTCVLVLSQMSEEAIKRKKQTHTPGAKGGGAVPQAADFLFTTAYQHPDDDESDYVYGDGERAMLKLTLRLSRYAEAGSHIFNYLPVDPITGWILPHETRNADDLLRDRDSERSRQMRLGLKEQEDDLDQLLIPF